MIDSTKSLYGYLRVVEPIHIKYFGGIGYEGSTGP